MAFDVSLDNQRHAAVVQLALAHLGRTERVSLYDGAWSEWGSNDKFPLATGPPPEA